MIAAQAINLFSQDKEFEFEDVQDAGKNLFSVLVYSGMVINEMTVNDDFN